MKKWKKTQNKKQLLLWKIVIANHNLLSIAPPVCVFMHTAEHIFIHRQSYFVVFSVWVLVCVYKTHSKWKWDSGRGEKLSAFILSKCVQQPKKIRVPLPEWDLFSRNTNVFVKCVWCCVCVLWFRPFPNVKMSPLTLDVWRGAAYIEAVTHTTNTLTLGGTTK